jgi:large subunit ribosomal protein L25
MQKHQVQVEKRTVLGKKVKKLRKSGILPANIYGKGVQSLAVQLPYDKFEEVFEEAGETGVVNVVVDGQTRPTLIHNVQYDHITQEPVHADFYQVNLKEKVTTMVPVVLVGEAKAVTEKLGLVLQPMSEVEVEALPTDLPENIEVDVTNLAAVDDQLMVSDLKAPSGVEIVSDKDQVVVKIGELVTQEAAEEAAAAEAAAEEAKAEGAEGATENAEAVSEQAKEAPAEGKEETK